MRAFLSPKLGTEVGGFRLEAKLGAGSFGTVFCTRRGDSAFAIKFLFLPEAAEWARRELEVLLRLRRSGVVAVEGHGQWPDTAPRFLFLVLPYVRGRSLYDWAQALNPSAQQVATGMAAPPGPVRPQRYQSGPATHQGVAIITGNSNETGRNGGAVGVPRRMFDNPRDGRLRHGRIWPFSFTGDQTRREEGTALAERAGRTDEDDPLLRPLAVPPAVHEPMRGGVRQ